MLAQINAQIKHLQLGSALPGLAITTTLQHDSARLGLAAMLKPRFWINREIAASLRTLSPKSTVPTRVCTLILQHDSARPLLSVTRVKGQSVTVAVLLPTVIIRSPQSPLMLSETTFTQVIPNAQTEIVLALKIDVQMSTSSLKLKGGNLTKTQLATTQSFKETIPFPGLQHSIQNGMICTKPKLAYMIQMPAGEHGESIMILLHGISALSRTLDNGTKKKLPIYKACLSVNQEKPKNMKSAKLLSNILFTITKLIGVSACKLTQVHPPEDPLFPIRTAIWTESRPTSGSWKIATWIAKSLVRVLVLSPQSNRSPQASSASTCSALSLAPGGGEQESSRPTAPTSAAVSSSSS